MTDYDPNTQPIIALDIESTGPNQDRDRIVQLTFAWPDGQGGISHDSWLVNPGVPIPPEATEVHGIRDDHVAFAPHFEDIAAEVQARVRGAILLGFNTRKFDTIMLHRHLVEAGQDAFDLDEVVEIDPFRMWLELEGRDLASWYRRYTGGEHEDTHSSVSDATILFEGLEAMVRVHGLTFEDVLELSAPERLIDRAGKFERDEEGVVRFTFSKNKGLPVFENVGMLHWMLKPGQDFPEDTLEVCRRLIEESKAPKSAIDREG